MRVLSLLVVVSIAVWAAPLLAQPASEPQPASLAVVVLTGDARDNTQLSEVIAELLLRQGVQAEVESRERFEPNAWLDAGADDARSFAFVSVDAPHRAQLYFRGPRGQRFMLRELALRDGLDEVGRELIARVVETSTVALMSAGQGVTREEARAELAVAQAEAQPQPGPPASLNSAPPTPASEPRSSAAAWNALLGIRVLGQWTGSDLGARIGLGLEGGARFRAGWLYAGARLTAELALPQQLDAGGVAASVLTVPLRLGVDLGSALGLYLGLSTGFDVVHLEPERADDEGLQLAGASTELDASSRAELRYELPLGDALYLALGVFIDIPWQRTHFDVVQDGTLKHLATPWRVQPGLAIALGALP